LLGNFHTIDPKVINVNKSLRFPPALRELQAVNEALKKTKLRAIKYLNNKMQNDHKFTKSKSRYRQWYQSFLTARNTFDGMETMRMIQKGQARYVGKDVIKQNKLYPRFVWIGGIICQKDHLWNYLKLIFFTTVPYLLSCGVFLNIFSISSTRNG
jgi:hypothetical protein